MINTQHRFHGRSGLSSVYRSGSTVRSPQISLKYNKNNRPEGYRAAVVVSRKIHKSAVRRNRVRRRIYEIIRREIPKDTQADIIVSIFSDQVISLSAEELQSLITGLLRRAKII